VTVRCVFFVGLERRRLVQRFAGCRDIEHGKQKCRTIFPTTAVISKAEPVDDPPYPGVER
jgi:hypothetical protein